MSLHMSQQVYVENISRKFRYAAENPASTPMQSNQRKINAGRTDRSLPCRSAIR